jgi:type IV fimbrial biogenesis protein FimT
MASGRVQRGMSLVEVLVAIGIIALVLGLGAPTALVWIQNLQVRNAGEAILNGLQTARLEALRRNTTIAFELTDPNSTAWHVCVFDLVKLACAVPDLATGDPSGQANARVGVETQFTNFSLPLDPGVNVPSLVAFDSFGRISPQSPTNIARIDIRNPTLTQNDERRLSVAITVAGQVRMCDPQLSKAVNPQGCQ